MGKMRTTQLLGLGVILLTIFIVGAFTSPYFIPPKTEDEKIGVVVTIPPQAEFVERVGGERVRVTIMVPPGANPHTYEPTPSQMVEVSKAKIYVMVGSGVEFELAWMDKIVEQNRAMLVVNCSEGIEFLEMGGRKDPHVWLSPLNAKIMVDNIRRALKRIDPQNGVYYDENAEAYFQELDELNMEIRNALENVTNRRFMVYHPAWGYFAKTYNLTQIPIEREGKEPTPAGLAALIDQAKKYNIKVIFVSPQFSTVSARVIAREIGGKVVLVDPLARDYARNLRMAAAELVRGMTQNG